MKLFGQPVARVRTRYGRVLVPDNDTVIGRALKLYGEWAEEEIGVLSAYVKADTAIVDVGANIGTHSIAFSKRFPKARIFSVEPQPLSFALLCANLCYTNCENVFPYNAAAGRRLKRVPLVHDYDGVDNFGALSFSSSPTATGNVLIAVVTIDSIVGEAPVGLIKIDVEGAEASVLEGAVGVIGASKPVIFFEALSVEVVEECMRVLSGFEYDFYWLKTSAYSSKNFNRVDYSIWAAGEVGVLCVPKGHETPHDLPRIGKSISEIPRA